MEKNTIITLDDNSKYILIDELNKNKKKYFIAIKLDNNENPTTEYELFEMKRINDEKYMNIVDSDEIKESILINIINKYIKDKEK